MMNAIRRLTISNQIKWALIAIALVCASSQAFANELSRHTANRVHRAFELQQNEQADQAIELLEQTDSSRSYDTAYVSRMLGVLYWQQQMPDKSEQALRRAVESGALPTEQAIESERMLADIQLSMGEPQSALTHYLSVVKQDSESQTLGEEALISVRLRISQAHYQLQNWSQVLESLSHYHALQPEADITTLSMALGAQIALEKWQEAIAITQKLRALEPEKKLWWKQLTSLYLNEKQYANALASLKQMERAGFELEQSNYIAMAQLYALQGAPELAARTYEQNINTLQPDDKTLMIEAQYWQQAREWDKSLLTWQQAVKLDSGHRWSYIQLLMQQKQFDDALSELNAVEISQRSELAKTQAYYRTGRIEEAKKSAKRAHSIEASDATLGWIKYLN